MKMKGALGIPTEILVGLVIAGIIIMVALVFFGLIPGVTGQQTAKGYFEACCIGYNINGHCGGTAADSGFQCTVSSELAAGGKMKIGDLAAATGIPVESCCKK